MLSIENARSVIDNNATTFKNSNRLFLIDKSSLKEEFTSFFLMQHLRKTNILNTSLQIFL